MKKYRCLCPGYRNFKQGEIYIDQKVDGTYISTLARLYEGDWEIVEEN